MALAPKSVLNEEETANVRRLVQTLQDSGTRITLLLHAVKDAGHAYKVVVKAYRYAIDDLINCNPDSYFECAHSLAMVNLLARGANYPDDFLLTDEALVRCIDAYFDSQRDVALEDPDA